MNALVLSGSLRSGQRVEHDGDVTLLGNIHEGAEIQASGNVFIRGRLKGVVHAGADGGACEVRAERFEAAQVRIGGKVATALDSGHFTLWGKSVCIALENGRFVVRELAPEELRRTSGEEGREKPIHAALSRPYRGCSITGEGKTNSAN